MTMLSRHHAIPAANLDRGPAERAVLRFVPARADNFSPGYYVARRRSWLSAASWVIVLVSRARPDTKLGRTSNLLWVYAPGVQKASRIQDWLFRARVLGMGEVSQEWRELAAAALGLAEEPARVVALR